ncbi:hypothetical protein GGX14DRAFT_393030 [Mycena pura]|uniref:Uncharacterized protein n=1 Tax=Mycena pura TaxID=153505 RepID=A0AAD6VI01_9AGAR|nr:hypothetical protein GGX14DRAFT_393030 [Mycena pura]
MEVLAARLRRSNRKALPVTDLQRALDALMLATENSDVLPTSTQVPRSSGWDKTRQAMMPGIKVKGLKRRRTSQGDPRVPPATAPPAASTPPPSTAPPAASMMPPSTAPPAASMTPPSTAPPAASTTPPSTAPPATSTTPPSTAPPASAPSAIQTTSTSAPSAIQTTSTLPSTAPPTAHPGRRAATQPKRHKYTSAPSSGAEAHATRRAPGPQFLFYVPPEYNSFVSSTINDLALFQPLVRHITAGVALPKPRRAPPFPIWKAGGGEL